MQLYLTEYTGRVVSFFAISLMPFLSVFLTVEDVSLTVLPRTTGASVVGDASFFAAVPFVFFAAACFEVFYLVFSFFFFASFGHTDWIQSVRLL
jgi:hypothetical protein